MFTKSTYLVRERVGLLKLADTYDILFTSADNYVIAVTPGQPQEAVLLLIAAGIAIDTVFKEQ